MKKLFLWNSLFWFVVHMVISTLGTRIPSSFFIRYTNLFKSWPFEEEGRFWQKYFKVKVWKQHLPNGQSFNPAVRSHTTVAKSASYTELHQFIIETRRAELIHALSILPAFIFLPTSKPIKYINLTYAFAANLPCWIAQRYNRPNLERYAEKVLQREKR
ncbi:glycosyl-4,4'-diaponeurosporenoate acyltransferase [Staphylococcus debuckii]|uniref:glycosyl-4,4'-diaponeurosporenoate acyltransferase CrtO family protein n=1 Tax=Staphylococcus debuckii TaxID=2044912 RepID=UPI000F437B0D|nr:glycosyl-4,4'-diaponeurosporenoate acyltransferase [Staphylococcus debuckii]AYU54168.1 glycosyl-4,4'-diaponeurosporenoate acyltransferase [Staphylococcus debuckii]